MSTQHLAWLPWPGGTYLGRGKGVPTLARGYLPWPGEGGTYLGRGGSLLWPGVPTLARGGGPLREYLLLGGRYASCVLVLE